MACSIQSYAPPCAIVLMRLCSVTLFIGQTHVHSYKTAILRASKVPFGQWNSLDLQEADAKRIIDLLLNLKAKFKTSRQLLKRMGELSGQGIEPEEQTILADETEALPGVLCAGVPGAGGVDAIFALTLSPAARTGVEDMWSQRGGCTSTSKNDSDAGGGSFVCPLTLSTSSEKAGICFEKDISWE